MTPSGEALSVHWASLLSNPVLVVSPHYNMFFSQASPQSYVTNLRSATYKRKVEFGVQWNMNPHVQAKATSFELTAGKFNKRVSSRKDRHERHTIHSNTIT